MRRFVLVVAALAVTAGCDQAVETELAVATSSIPDPAPERALLWPANLSQTAPLPPSEPRIARHTALELAGAYLKEFGPYTRGALEREHGAPIDFSNLEPLGEGFISHSPYQASNDLPIPERNLLGGYYIFEFGQAGVPVIRIGVAASATHLRIVEGTVRGGNDVGNEFRTIGVPIDPAYFVVTSPSQASEIVAQRTRTPVSQEPQFTSYGIRWYPHFGAWRVPLAGAVPVIRPATGERVTTTVLFVTWNGVIGLPVAPVAEDAYVMRYRNRLAEDEPRTLRLEPAYGPIVPVSIPSPE